MTVNQRNLTRPGKLKPGDAVGVVAPAGVVDSRQLEKGLRVLQRMGLKPVLGKHVGSRNGFLAGSDQDRAEDLMAMFENPAIRAILCARGGYGANRILSHLRPGVIRQNTKILVGASDITLLLLYLQRKCSLVAFHGPMVAGNFGCHAMRKTKPQFFDILTRKASGKKLHWPGARVLKAGSARGEVVGGCLTILCRSLKTPWEIQTRGRIVLIEDVNEPLYRLDGMLWQLKTAGKFKGVRAVLFGEMVNCRPAKPGEGSVEDVVREVFREDSFPVMMKFPVGHGKEMWTLPMGVNAALETESKSLVFEECGVV